MGITVHSGDLHLLIHNGKLSFAMLFPSFWSLRYFSSLCVVTKRVNLLHPACCNSLCEKSMEYYMKNKDIQYFFLKLKFNRLGTCLFVTFNVCVCNLQLQIQYIQACLPNSQKKRETLIFQLPSEIQSSQDEWNIKAIYFTFNYLPKLQLQWFFYKLT